MGTAARHGLSMRMAALKLNLATFYQGKITNMDTELTTKIRKLRDKGQTLAEIANKCHVSPALIWKIERGKCTSNKVRIHFGLPPKTVEAEPCMLCGEVHTQKTCVHTRPKEKRHRRAGEFTGERVALYDAMLADLNTSTTEILNGVLDRWIEYHE